MARLDVGGVEALDDAVDETGLATLDDGTREPAVVVAVVVTLAAAEQAHAVEVGERVGIQVANLPAARDHRVEPLELADAERREQVRHAVVVPHLGVLVPRRGLTSLRRQVTRASQQLGVVAQQHSATGRRHDLVAVERDRRTRPERPARRAVETRTERLRSILDERNAALGEGGHERRVVDRTAVQIDRDDRGDVLTPRAQRVDGLDHERDVDVRVTRLRIDEHGRRTRVDDRVRRGSKRHRRHDDDVTGPDAVVQQRQVQRSRARRERQRAGDPGALGDLRLETVDHRAQGSDPPRAQRLDDELLLALGDGGLRQVNACHQMFSPPR